jgi:hypothetical protein
MIRVYWSWYNTEDEAHKGEVVWEAPPNARWYFGNTRALYKMYFTSQMKDPLETADESACLRFAKDFLPVVNDALAEMHLNQPGELVTAEAPTASASGEAAAGSQELLFNEPAEAGDAALGDAATTAQPAAAQ